VPLLQRHRQQDERHSKRPGGIRRTRCLGHWDPVYRSKRDLGVLHCSVLCQPAMPVAEREMGKRLRTNVGTCARADAHLRDLKYSACDPMSLRLG
jgi:hypothetical protein